MNDDQKKINIKSSAFIIIIIFIFLFMLVYFYWLDTKVHAQYNEANEIDKFLYQQKVNRLTALEKQQADIIAGRQQIELQDRQFAYDIVLQNNKIRNEARNDLIKILVEKGLGDEVLKNAQDLSIQDLYNLLAASSRKKNAEQQLKEERIRLDNDIKKKKLAIIQKKKEEKTMVKMNTLERLGNYASFLLSNTESELGFQKSKKYELISGLLQGNPFIFDRFNQDKIEAQGVLKALLLNVITQKVVNHLKYVGGQITQKEWNRFDGSQGVLFNLAIKKDGEFTGLFPKAMNGELVEEYLLEIQAGLFKDIFRKKDQGLF